MIWNKFINHIKKGTNNKEWLNKLIESLENQRHENISLAFKIIEIKSKGFLVKVSGAYAFVNFNHMPWVYNNIDSWLAISSKLIGKTFYCKIFKIEKEPLSIIIDARIPQFKKVELETGEEYTGIIVQKSTYGVFIDIGFHFNWRHGSLLGLLHKSKFNTKKSFSDFSTGSEIKIFYEGLNENSQLSYYQSKEIIDYNNRKSINDDLLNFIGKTVIVLVSQKSDEQKKKLLVNGKYKGRIVFTKEDDFLLYRGIIKRMKNNLKDGDKIICKVISIKEKTKVLELQWLIELDNEFMIDNSFINFIDDNINKSLKNKENKNEYY